MGPPQAAPCQTRNSTEGDESFLYFLLLTVLTVKVAEPTGGGEAVTEAYDALKEKMTEARTEGSASPTPPTEETATPAF